MARKTTQYDLTHYILNHFRELKKRTHDTSDLVSVRRPVLLSLFDKERKSQISRLPDRFNESLFPCKF